MFVRGTFSSLPCPHRNSRMIHVDMSNNSFGYVSPDQQRDDDFSAKGMVGWASGNKPMGDRFQRMDLCVEML